MPESARCGCRAFLRIALCCRHRALPWKLALRHRPDSHP
ncbi:hypothetical protein FDP08_14735 [Marinobacter panjinensis]|uniref:Uncharacterized protein n=1 Tax=Marinobacter panjinensis TaxID=2576384 RepID=A0A4V6CY30_9GAMM|nr:hypothetical protein FDP08_14735 [Marinobacter panjinensis]